MKKKIKYTLLIIISLVVIIFTARSICRYNAFNGIMAKKLQEHGLELDKIEIHNNHFTDNKNKSKLEYKQVDIYINDISALTDEDKCKAFSDIESKVTGEIRNRLEIKKGSIVHFYDKTNKKDYSFKGGTLYSNGELVYDYAAAVKNNREKEMQQYYKDMTPIIGMDAEHLKYTKWGEPIDKTDGKTVLKGAGVGGGNAYLWHDEYVWRHKDGTGYVVYVNRKTNRVFGIYEGYRVDKRKCIEFNEWERVQR